MSLLAVIDRAFGEENRRRRSEQSAGDPQSVTSPSRKTWATKQRHYQGSPQRAREPVNFKVEIRRQVTWRFTVRHEFGIKSSGKIRGFRVFQAVDHK